jgi:hypothetical protein
MASGASKFKFVSPGIFINEIDRSQLPADPRGIGPVVVGRTEKGPGMRPIRISSYSEFVRVFGAPVPGGDGGDNWRENDFDGPTYGAYAAQAWLRSGQGPVTMVRLLGAEHRDFDSGGEAGWDTGATNNVVRASNGGAYGLFLINSGTTGLTASDFESGSLAAVWYLREGASIALTGSGVFDGLPVTGSAVLMKSSGPNKEFTVNVYDNFDTLKERVCFNFNRNSERYIRDVFNTSPSQTNTTIVTSGSTNQYNYWLGETYDQFVETQVGNTAQGSVLGVIMALNSGSADGDDFQYNFQDAESPWFHSQDLGDFSSFHLGTTPRLFKLVALDFGSWPNSNIKVSIENLRAADYPDIDPYGTFSVVLRAARDTDNVPQVLERYDLCNLNPNSENFIGRKIGDKYLKWDAEQRRLREYGDYANQSYYVRVVVDDAITAGGADATCLPFGYFGPPRYKGWKFGLCDKGNAGLTGSATAYDPAATTALFGAVAAGDISQTYVTGGVGIAWTGVPTAAGVVGGVAPNPYTAGLILSASLNLNHQMTGTFIYPQIRLRTTASDGDLTDPTDAYFGIQTTRSPSSLIFDHSYGDMTRPKPSGVSTFVEGTNTEHSFAFTMDDIVSGSGTGAAFYYESGSRVGSGSYAGTGGRTYKDLLDAGYDKFTAPIFGGFDGLNIQEKEPFRNTLLSGKTEFNNYAFNTIKRAIDTVADPEFVEANLMALPGVTNSTLTRHLVTTCEARADALAIIDIEHSYTPAGTEGTSDAVARRPNVSQAISSLRTRSLNSSYGCCFFPWVQIRDTSTGRIVDVPPSVPALGTFGSSEARTELWFAPAGFVRGGLSQGAGGLPVTGVKMRLTSKDRDNLYAANINPIATFPSEGIVIFGQKTLQVTRSALDRINVRRLLIYVKKEISRIAAGVLFDPNVQATWDRFTGAVNPFLGSVKARFGLTDFKVVLDGTTTTPDLVDRNVLYAKIYLKPARAIEFIALDFIITRTGASFDD